MSQTVDATENTDNTDNTETSEVTEVGGGKVWSPEDEEEQISLTDKLISFGLIGFLITVVVTSIHASYTGATGKMEYEGVMTPELWNYGTFGNPGGMPDMIYGSIFLTLAALVVFFIFDAKNKIAFPASIALGALSLTVCLFSYNSVIEWYQDPKTNPVTVWADETYNYKLVEFINDNDNPEDTSGTKLLVNDLTTGEEKIVNYYERNNRVYLAVDDADLLSQIKADDKK